MMVFNDNITLYAAQASFFIIIATIPFIILLLSLAKYIINVESVVFLIESRLDSELGSLLKGILSEMVGKTGISLVSLTAFSTFWASARGVKSVMKGITEVYGIRAKEPFVFEILRSFVYTIAFIFILLLCLLAFVFGGTIVDAIGNYIPLVPIIYDVVKSYSAFVFFVLLTLFFALMFNTGAKHGMRGDKKEYLVLSEYFPTSFGWQLPGAFFASSGWMLFSYIYSLYIRYFPNASYIYGSIAAVVFMMLWLYACLIILLLGAELNKMISIIRMKIRWRRANLPKK